MFNSQSNTPLSDLQFSCLVKSFKNELTSCELAELEAAREAFLREFPTDEQGMAERLFWTSVPGFKSFWREWEAWPSYRKFSNTGKDTPRSCWEAYSYRLHAGKVGAA